jgi:predicted RNA-binding Zn ribbon-like protein
MVNSLDLVKDFVNTLHGDDERLVDPPALEAWLDARGLADGERVTRAGLRRATELREALRVLLLANNAVLVDSAAAYDVLDAAARRAGVALRFLDGAPVLAPAATGVDRALGAILAAVHGAISDGSWPRLKACRARDCEWAFVDSARNQSRAWCSMRSCGNREKARSYRHRHRGHVH